MREILLSCGVTLQVSDVDFLFVLGQSWTVNSYGYVVGTNAKRHPFRNQQLGRVLAVRMQLDLSHEIDHKDRNPLNFQRDNLRPATDSQQEANKAAHNRFGIKGIKANRGRWQARLKKNGRTKHLGTFDTPEQAAEAYRQAAIEAFGEYACVD